MLFYYEVPYCQTLPLQLIKSYNHKMEVQEEVILQSVSQLRTNPLDQSAKPRSRIGIFSMVLLGTMIWGIYHWYLSYTQYIKIHPIDHWNHYTIASIIQFGHQYSFQESVLKYKVYKLFTCAYTQPNILLALAILLTFPLINSIERQTSTVIAFYQYNGLSIYLQIIRTGLDGFQYLLTGRCYCLTSGTAAVWINMLTKILYYRLPYLLQRRYWIIPVSLVYLLAAVMLVLTARVDLLISVLVAIIDIMFLNGGTISYPKSVFDQKQTVADYIKINRLSIWHPFRWNDYRQNHLCCLNCEQYYLTIKQRLNTTGSL